MSSCFSNLAADSGDPAPAASRHSSPEFSIVKSPDTPIILSVVIIVIVILPLIGGG
jgi:hypothetical protein